MREYLDKFMGWLGDKLRWLPKLGGGVHWVTESGKVVYLWPFVAVALILAIIFVLDKVIP